MTNHPRLLLTNLEHVLDRELHNPRAVVTAQDPAERICVAQRDAGVAAAQAVGKVESLGAELDLLAFTNLELTRNRLAPIPVSGTDNAALTDVAVGALRRYCERCSIEEGIQGLGIAVRTRQHLVWTLRTRVALE